MKKRILSAILGILVAFSPWGMTALAVHGTDNVLPDDVEEVEVIPAVEYVYTPMQLDLPAAPNEPYTDPFIRTYVEDKVYVLAPAAAEGLVIAPADGEGLTVFDAGSDAFETEDILGRLRRLAEEDAQAAVTPKEDAPPLVPHREADNTGTALPFLCTVKMDMGKLYKSTNPQQSSYVMVVGATEVMAIKEDAEGKVAVAVKKSPTGITTHKIQAGDSVTLVNLDKLGVDTAPPAEAKNLPMVWEWT